jgi:Arc/MetJ-type ribon-helix-helix transcriptional regulator
MKNKRRLSVSVRPELVEAAEAAVAEGRAPSISAWVDEALRLKVERDRRLEALTRFVEEYEAEHGAISEEEVRSATRDARERATVVRGKGPTRGSGR